MNLTNISIFISKVLRHQPQIIDIEIEYNGAWADVEQLIDGVRRKKDPAFDRAALEEIVATDNKQRYSFNEDGTKIRANQGHSIPVVIDMERPEPPEFLWHGTGEKYVESIDRMGLIPKSRLYVHLSADRDTALIVGKRHGRPVIYKVYARKMAEDGHLLMRSANGVWQAKAVPLEYLEKCE